MNVLLGVTGSVAAMKTPELVAALCGAGHDVRLVATHASTYFFDVAGFRDITTLDEDEWPGERYSHGDGVRHIELRNWADALIIAPLDANTLAKLAAGLCDNALTCVWRAWDQHRRLVLAPAMNTLMWSHPATRRNLRRIAADYQIQTHEQMSEDALCAQINASPSPLRIATPVVKLLACGDTGLGAMADVKEIVRLTADEAGKFG